MSSRAQQEARVRAITARAVGNKELERRRARAADLRGKTQRREIATGDLELRELVDENVIRFSGYAALFEPSEYQVTEGAQGFRERIAPNAFHRCLSQPNGPDVILNLDHGRSGSGLPLARSSNGTLRLSEDARGLKVEADLLEDDPDTRLLAVKLRSGALGAMSFAFRCTRDEWDDEYRRRRLLEVNLNQGDVSVVAFPCNPETEASIRSRSAQPPSRATLVMSARARRAQQERAVKAIQKAKP
jgi:HK97 family phage prohead protease